jgi:hypothetical protein
LVPQDKNQNLDQLQESEGALSKDNTGEKKNKGDFNFGTSNVLL